MTLTRNRSDWIWYATILLSVVDQLDHFLVAIVMDAGQGNANNEATWDDTNVARLDSIPAAQLHCNVDGPILAADKEAESSQHASTPQRVYLHTFKRVLQGFCPPTIFGFATGKLVDLGVQNTRSIQIPMAVASSVARKHAGHIGKGENMWPLVHINNGASRNSFVT